ncbi:MAG TPA: hypothetical protein VHT04_10945 [Stellaceae bacterium]|jgi:hypothetical protein|nr:hypothetical protein [Stellaceae bacterium]
MTLRDRIGVDIGRRLKLEDAVIWAADHNVRYIDIQLDTEANALTSFDDGRCAAIRVGNLMPSHFLGQYLRDVWLAH